MFRVLHDGDGGILADALADSRLTVLVGRDDQFFNMLQNVGDRPDRATFFFSSNGVVDEDQEARWFGDDGSAAVVLLDYNAPNRRVVVRFTANDHPTLIVDAVLDFEAAQAHEGNA